MGVLIGFSFVFSLAVFLPNSESAIPPTNAFSKIATSSQNLVADTYSDFFNIVTQGQITSSITANNTVNIKLVQKTCGPGQAFVGIAANGTMICGIP